MKWNRNWMQDLKRRRLEREENAHRKEVIDMTWPVFIELILGSLFGMLDMMMLGQIPDPIVSSYAISTVGITNQPLFLGISLAQAINIGGTATISRYVGMGRRDEINNVLRHTILLNFLFIAIPFSVIMQLNAIPIMRFIGATDEVLGIGLTYFRIIMVSYIFQAMTFSFTAALRGIGETRVPMRINLITNGFNVVGNALLIHGLLFFPKLGVTGAAVSTLIANIIGLSLMLRVLIKGYGPLKLELKGRFRFSKDILYNLVKVGLPSAGEQLILRVALISYTRVVTGLGMIVYAAHQTAINILNISFSNGQAFSISSATLVARYLGQGEPEEAEAVAREARKIGVKTATVVGLVLFFFGAEIASLFSNNPEVIQNAAVALRIIALLQPFQNANLILAGAMRGAGDTVFTMITILVCILIIRVGFAKLFINVLGLGLAGAWYATFIDQFTRWFIINHHFNSNKWKTIELR